MRKRDELFIDDPTLDVLGMIYALMDFGMNDSPRRIRKLLRKMGMEAISPKRNPSRW